MGIEICDLRRKFQLLKTYGCISSLNDIAEKVGRAEKTVWGWADGNATTKANRVPPNNFEAFRSAFIDALADQVSAERAAELLFAPAAHLEVELRRTRSASLMDLIEEEADTSAIRLIRHPQAQTKERGLIETQLDRSPSEPKISVKKDEWFRLVVERDLRSMNIIALQNGNALWGVVPWALERDSGYPALPGFMQSGAPTFMRERNTVGPNTFVVIATRQPPTSGIMDMMSGQHVLDQSALATLADFARQHPKTSRQLFSINVIVE